MDLSLTVKAQEFRDRFAEWLRTAVPEFRASLRRAEGEAWTTPDRMKWERVVFDAGWSGPSWPVEYGGLGLTIVEQLLYYEELARVDAPEEVNRVGTRILGPTLLEHGTTTQKQRYLHTILNATEYWCQGFSEPEAGSDLASLRTTARLDGDEYVLNGQKIWTTNAHLANHMFALVRTDTSVSNHAGLSYMIVDMRTSGIEVRPITDLTGSQEFNEVYFDDVRVPAENVIGSPNEGWKMAGESLKHERTVNIAGRAFRAQRQAERISQWVQQTRSGSSAAHAELSRHEALSYVDAYVMRCAAYRAAAADPEEVITIGAILKVTWSEGHQRMLARMMDALDDTEPSYAKRASWATLWEESFAETIYAGTSEILRNIISERRLGLPRRSS